MKSAATPIIVFIVFLSIFTGAIASLLLPIVKHYHAKYQHYRMIQARRDQFYLELRYLMRSA